MPEKIKSVLICKEGDKEVYRPGDKLSGYWKLTSEKPFTTKGIILSLKGAAFVKWTETRLKGADDEYISHEIYIDDNVQAFGRGDAKEQIHPGVYKYPFNFQIPQRPIPSSYEGSKGAIRYILQIRIRKPLPFPDVVRYSSITILEELDVNSPTHKNVLCLKKSCQVPKALGFGDAGTVELWGKLDRRAYCPGEQIALSFTAKNTSTQKLGKVRAKLMQYVTFTANGSEEYSNSNLATITSINDLEIDKTFNWKNQLIRIDGIPPTIDRPSCQCISVRYYVEVFVSVPFFTGRDLKLVFPVKIGTVPLGKSLRSVQPQPSNIQVLDASQAITYTKCNKGWSQCNESSSSRGFPNLNYTPMCAYAVDFDFHKIQSASLKAAGVSANASTTRQAAGNKSQTKTAVKSQNPRLPNSTAPISQPSSSSSASTSSNVSLPLGTTSTSSTSTSQNTRVQLFTTPSLPPSSSNKAVASSGISVTSDNRPIPSAPPLQFQDQEIGQDTAPPTYEEAMGEDYASVDVESDDEDSDLWYMLIRFTKADMDKFISFVQNNKKFFEIHGGKLIFKSIKQYKPIGDWLFGKNILMISFPSKNSASEWIKSIPNMTEVSWWQNCDILVTPVKEKYQIGKNTVMISQISWNEENNEAVQRYKNLLRNITQPIRILHGGVLCVSTDSYHVLHGNWSSDDKVRISILVWPDLEMIKKYQSSLAEIQATIDDLKKQCMVIHSSCSFNIANFSEEDLE